MTKNRLTQLRVDEVSAVTKGANGKTFLILKAAATKTEGGNVYTASDYAYVPNAQAPGSWKLRLTEYVDGTKQVTAAQVGRAASALSAGGFRGQKVEIPEADLAGVKAKVRAAWKKCNPDKDPRTDMPESIKKTDEPSLFGWVREAFRKVAGTSGPTDGGTEMTPDEVKKAVAEGAAEILAPLDERLKALEGAVAKAAEEEGAEEAEAPAADVAASATDELTPDGIKKIVGEAVAEQIAPILKRIEVVETAAGARQSGLEEGGAHPVKKNADGSFSWEGAGLLM